MLRSVPMLTSIAAVTACAVGGAVVSTHVDMSPTYRSA